ncbi:hypothetical protein [Kurthia zopfii]|uniref:hypothetical protein n=1 Tax=Kurthia zopfii TaxID=1650 RepID=UPI000F6F28C4|nr:hypothetical protein [Kurthia zopfii]VEI07665.1 Uncharacterised protein [Kurthia zopfii]
MDSSIMNFPNIKLNKQSFSSTEIKELIKSDVNYHPIFIHLELYMDKKLCSEENVTIAVLRPNESTVIHIEGIEMTEIDIAVTLKSNETTGKLFLQKIENDKIDMDYELTTLKIDRFLVCHEKMNSPLTLDELKSWVEEKYLINEKKSVAVSFYTFKKKENSYNERKYFKSIISYRYIFKSDIDL